MPTVGARLNWRDAQGLTGITAMTALSLLALFMYLRKTTALEFSPTGPSSIN